jgi:hypothetical protein
MTEALVREAFRRQALSCRDLGSPFTAKLCDVLAEILQPEQGMVARRILGWRGDPSSRGDSVPLRLCGALHAVVLTGRDPALRDAYAARRINPALLQSVLAAQGGFILDWLDSPPQTNEVARSAAIIAAARFAAGLAPLRLRVMELGTSAGLNLNFAHYDLRPNDSVELPDQVILTPKWRGDVPQTRFEVAEAEGVDLRPIDAAKDGLRLMSYCWADQVQRLTRLRAALTLASTYPPRISPGDAGEWLTDRLSQPAPGRLGFVFHTIAAQYFPESTRRACETALRRAGDRATAETPLAHFSMEADDEGEGAGLTLRFWNGDFRTWRLGRADFHGRWIDWAPRLQPAF